MFPSMNPTAQVKSTRNRNKLIVNVSIQIPLKNKIHHSFQEQEEQIVLNPQRKKEKSNVTPYQCRQNVQTTSINTVKNNVLSYNSKKKPVSINHTERRPKLHEWEVSPKKRNYQTTRKLKDKSIFTKNLSILERVINEDDNIIKYTSNSSEIKEKWQDIQPTTKIHTNVSDLDVTQIRKIQNQLKQSSQKLFLLKINDFLKNACAKKIQRVWRNYKTKKLIRSYSDIKSSHKRNDSDNLNAKSQKINFGFKKSLKKYEQLVEANEDKEKLQSDNLQRWESLLEHIQKKKPLVCQQIQQSKPTGFFSGDNVLVNDQKIIKTKSYYEAQRQKWREFTDKKQQIKRVNQFESQILKIESDYSDSDRSGHSSIGQQNPKKIEQLQNIKLKKKLQIFKNHLFDMPQSTQRQSSKTKNKHKQDDKAGQRNTTVQIIQINYQQFAEETNQLLQQGVTSPQSINFEWITRLKELMMVKEVDFINVLIEQLIYQAIIELSSFKKWFEIAQIFNEKKKSKAQGVITNQLAIKDYINYFISFIYQQHKEQIIAKGLNTPLGLSPLDALKYIRGYQIDYDSNTELIMNLSLFNQHWDYESGLIYFDSKWKDQKKQAQRVHYLKQLTHIFFRAIFDCFNQALQHERFYGLRGKPYPWEKRGASKNIPTLKKALLSALSRVIKYSSIAAGILFEDKLQELNKQAIDEIQQSHLRRLIILQMKEQEFLWFMQEELLQVRLKLAQHIQKILFGEMLNFLRSKF